MLNAFQGKSYKLGAIRVKKDKKFIIGVKIENVEIRGRFSKLMKLIHVFVSFSKK